MKQKAFTLIELLVVVAIIGILAAVGVTTFSGFQEKAKINASKQSHVSIRNSIQAILGSCDIDGSVSYVNKNNYKVNITCNDSNGMHSPIINKHAGFQQGGKWWYGFQSPYSSDLVGVKDSPLLSYSGATGFNKKYKPLQKNGEISSGYICCATLGVVGVERVPIANASAKEFNCEGSCCFVITTAYGVDDNDNALTKIDTVSGSSCTR